MDKVSTTRNIQMIETEIKTLTHQANTMALQYIIEIGRRLVEAKDILEHGQWGEWLQDNVNYSQSSAENYIRIYKEYGDKQLSLFGDLSNSQSLANLGVAKLIELTAVPVEDRETFVTENDIENKTVKELRQLLKETTERAELAENEKDTLKIEIDDLSDLEDKYEEKIKQNLDSILEKERKIAELELEMQRISETEKTESQNELEQLKREAEREATEKQKNTLDKLKKQVEESRSNIERYKNAAELEKSERKQAEAERQSLRAEISKLEKQLENSSNENMIKVNLMFVAVQDAIDNLVSAFDGIQGNDNYEMLRSKINQALIEKLSEC